MTDHKQTEESMAAVRQMLSGSGFSDTAIAYYLDRPHMGTIPDPDLSGNLTGTCGDTMSVTLKVENGIITDAKYEVMGCAGAVSAAMAAVDLIKGKSLDYARSLNDGDIFKVLQDIPAKKHHCIQLAVKALHKALAGENDADPPDKET